MQAKTEIAGRESERHNRRLRELTGQPQTLVRLYYNGGVSEEVLAQGRPRTRPYGYKTTPDPF